ncbi:MAG: hypothetical protein RB148_08560 [Armatimonadota bacterium]|nr:hypothetical protein [Armatimonadota bacterium]MDR7474718.1 hypothetical protein [Armatimonadota bacterium]
MTWLRRLGGLFRGGGGEEGNTGALVFYVRCDHCGEVIRVRADRRSELLQEFDQGVSGYSLHKDVLGTRCNRVLRMHVGFDLQYRVISQEIEGGRFATAEEYRAAAGGRPG